MLPYLETQLIDYSTRANCWRWHIDWLLFYIDISIILNKQVAFFRDITNNDRTDVSIFGSTIHNGGIIWQQQTCIPISYDKNIFQNTF